MILLLLQGFQVTYFTKSSPLLFPISGDPWSALLQIPSAPGYCSFVHQLSLGVTQLLLCLWGRKSQCKPTAFMLCLLKGKRQKEDMCETVGSQPPVQGPSPNTIPPGYHPDGLPQCPDLLAVSRIPTVLGTSFIVSRIWVVTPFFFFFYAPLSRFQRTLWSLMSLFSQPP